MLVDLDPTVFFKRFKRCLVAELSRIVVFLFFREDVAQVVVAVRIVLVMAYCVLVGKDSVIELTERTICDA